MSTSYWDASTPTPGVRVPQRGVRTARRAYSSLRLDIRPEPRAITSTTSFAVPDRVFRTEGISFGAKCVGVALNGLARHGEREVTCPNKQISKFINACSRSVDSFLAELEAAGLIFRISRTSGRQIEDLKRLEAIGYRYQPGESGLPRRLIVLLWRLPHPGEFDPDTLAPSVSGR